MLSAKVYSQDNQEVGAIDLQENVFSVSVKPELMHQAVRAHRAAVRSGTVGVKNRALISGGGRKPWRQKGTGRARAGTGRSPLWRGGAIIHGPKARDYSIKLNKKVRRLALKMALSTKYAQDKLQIVDKIELNQIRTKDFVNIKNNLGLKKPLIVTAEKSNTLELSARNIPGVEVITHDSINVYEVLKHQELVIDKQAVEKLQERLG